MPYQFRFDQERKLWIVSLDGYDIKSFPTEDDARAYCAEMNNWTGNGMAPDTRGAWMLASDSEALEAKLAAIAELVEKWRNVPYTGNLVKAAKSVCADELAAILKGD